MRDSKKPATKTASASRRPPSAKPKAPRAKPVEVDAADPETVEWVFSLAKSERGHKRRAAILKAAADEFMQKGFQGASLRNIIKASGGSAETLYQQFGNKQGLFEAVVGAPREEHLQLLIDKPSGRPIDAELLDIARAFLTSAIRPDSIAMIRMMIGESGVLPEVSQMIWEFGPVRVHDKLANYFRLQAEAGVLNVPDPMLAARQFIGVTRAGLDVQVICGVTKPTKALIDHQAKLGVDLFLNGLRAQGGVKAPARQTGARKKTA